MEAESAAQHSPLIVVVYVGVTTIIVFQYDLTCMECETCSNNQSSFFKKKKNEIIIGR